MLVYLSPMSDTESYKSQLDAHHDWPSVYMFKFIVPSDNQKIALVQGLFTESAEFKMNQSSNGKFTSITVKEVMMNSDQVLERYAKAKGIEGVIAL